VTGDNPAIERAARTLLAHRANGTANPVLPVGQRLSDFTLAYAIQDAADAILRSERGFVQIGYKIAASNKVARDFLGIATPFHGRIYRQMASPSPARVPFVPDFFKAYEPEIGIQIGRDLDPSGAPFDAATIEAGTQAVLPAIELVGSHFVPWTDAGAPNLVSDNAAFAHWIMGEPIRDWSKLDLLDAPITLHIDGALRGTGSGRNVDGGAFGAAAWLANTLAAKGQRLRAGDYITTGIVMPPVPIERDHHAVADFGRLGRVEVRMTAR
jgi:2-oxo-3-hexenedioate decarboxylase/2-keto-4-pentenoate hydratase